PSCRLATQAAVLANGNGSLFVAWARGRQATPRWIDYVAGSCRRRERLGLDMGPAGAARFQHVSKTAAKTQCANRAAVPEYSPAFERVITLVQRMHGRLGTYLARGILAHAFARVRCSSCGDEMLVDRKLFALLENWKPTMSSACGGKVNVESDSCRGEEWFSARDKARMVRENNSSLPPKAACRLRRSSFIAEPRSSREARGPSGAQRQ